MLLPAIILLVFELCFLLKKRIEELLPVVAGTAVVLCYGLAVFQALAWFTWIIYALAVSALVWCLLLLARGNAPAQLRSFLTNAFTPGLLTFAILVLILAVAAAPHRVTHTDEVYVWSIQPLSIFSHQGFVDFYLNLSPRFMTYTPGVHLFQWIGLAVHGEWSEGVLFLWLWVLYAVLLLPVTRHITWRKAWQIPLYVLGIMLFPAIFNAEAYRILRVDTAVGIALGYATVQAYRLAREKEHRGFLAFSLGVALSLLVLIKQTGIGWALLPPVIVLLAGSKERGRKRSLRESALALLPPAAIYVSWKLVCHALGFTGQHLGLLASNTEQVMSGQFPPAGDLSVVAGALLRTMTFGTADASSGGFVLPQLAWLLIFLLFPILLYRTGRLERPVMKRFVGMMLVFYVLYFLAFYVALFTAFRPEWTSPANPVALAPLLANLQRYGCALWYALMMLYAELSLTPRAPEPLGIVQPGGKGLSRVLAVALIVATLISLPWQVLRENLLPGQYTEHELTGELDNLAANAFWRDSIDDPNAIVLLASDSYPNNRGWLQYALAPLKLVMPYETELDADDFRALLRDNHVGYFVSEGDANPLYQLATEFAQDGYLDAYTVYVVQWEEDDVTLVCLEQFTEVSRTETIATSASSFTARGTGSACRTPDAEALTGGRYFRRTRDRRAKNQSKSKKLPINKEKGLNNNGEIRRFIQKTGSMIWNRNLTQQQLAAWCAVVFALSLLPLIVIAPYNDPADDDFAYTLPAATAWVQTHSPVAVLQAIAASTLKTYNSWQGDFVSTFLFARKPHDRFHQALFSG